MRCHEDMPCLSQMPQWYHMTQYLRAAPDGALANKLWLQIHVSRQPDSQRSPHRLVSITLLCIYCQDYIWLTLKAAVVMVRFLQSSCSMLSSTFSVRRCWLPTDVPC